MTVVRYESSMQMIASPNDDRNFSRARAWNPRACHCFCSDRKLPSSRTRRYSGRHRLRADLDPGYPGRSHSSRNRSLEPAPLPSDGAAPRRALPESINRICYRRDARAWIDRSAPAHYSSGRKKASVHLRPRHPRASRTIPLSHLQNISRRPERRTHLAISRNHQSSRAVLRSNCLPQCGRPAS